VKVPCGVTTKGNELAQGWVKPFISPSEFSILEVNFLELAIVQGGSKTFDSAPIDIGSSLQEPIISPHLEV
jgi:hypothetical protein